MSLSEDLRRLADSAPAPSLDGDDLWARGVRTHRVRVSQIAVAVAAIVLAIGSVLTIDLVQRSSYHLAPAANLNDIHPPSTMYKSSQWLDSFSAASPPGRIAAASQSAKATFLGEPTPDVVAVSAVDGAYGYLDLPDMAASAEVAVSPDGRYLAFWQGQASIWGYPSPSAVAVYDAETGTVTSHSIESPAGVYIGSLVFADAVTLLYAYTDWAVDPQHPRDWGDASGILGWDLSTGVTSKLGDWKGSELVTDFHGTFFDHPWAISVADPDHPTRVRAAEVNDGGGRTGCRWYAAFDGGRRFASGDSGEPTRIQESRPGGVRTVPNAPWTYCVIAYVDATHLLVMSGADATNGWNPSRVEEVDTNSGDTKMIVDVSGTGDRWIWAVDVLAQEPVDWPAPPEPWSPWAKVWLAGGILLAGGVIVLGWRRRARR